MDPNCDRMAGYLAVTAKSRIMRLPCRSGADKRSVIPVVRQEKVWMGSLTPSAIWTNKKDYPMLFHLAVSYRRAMWRLVAFHLVIIAASNYLVQLPITLFGLHTTWGAFSFPFIFLATDLTVRIFGAPLARQIIWLAMLPALLLSYGLGVLFFEGQFQGVAELGTANLFVARIACASFMAYLLGQILDVSVFNRLRQSPRWWLAPTVSTLFGNLLDTLAFFSIAFWRSPDPFMAEHWVEIASVDYGIKLLISLGLFVPAYGVLLRYLQAKILGESQMTLQRQPG